ncbi:hypothetical protein [Cohnella sp. 56]|uniref:hypothetical protein n=1 Tax=Cohnella sp. 56 TaxID=3113722 RepID=UPI0030EA1985
MTSTEPMTYNPGPEFDRRIANLIGYVSMTTAVNLDGTYGYTPAYSTTWEGMRLVVEEMQRRGWDLGLFTDHEGWLAEFIILENGSLAKGRAETAPHAVCLACIAAIEGQKKEV